MMREKEKMHASIPPSIPSVHLPTRSSINLSACQPACPSKYLSIPPFSSTCRRPASYCDSFVSVVRPSSSLTVRACIRKLFLQKTSQKLLTGFLRNFTGMFLRRSSFKFLQIIVFYEEFWLPWRSK